MRGWYGVAAIAAFLIPGGCARPPVENVDTFVWAVKSKIRTLDPAEISDEVTGSALSQVFEPLTRVGPDGKPQGVLVNSFTPNDAVTEYSMNVRRGVVFSDGSLLDARVVVRSLERVRKGKGLRSAYGRQLLQGVREIFAKDEQTVVFRLDRPMASLPSRLSYPALAIVAASVPMDRPITDVKEMIGTGPFRPTEVVSGVRMELTARKDWHEAGPFVKNLRIETVEDSQLRLRKATAGEVDLTALAPSEAVAASADPGLRPRLRRTPRTALVYLQLQPASYPPLKDPRVRRAIWHAIDRNRLVADVQASINLLADGFVPPGVAGNDRIQDTPDLNVSRATELLAVAGHPRGAGLPPVKISVAASSNLTATAESIASDLRTNLGIEATVEVLPAEALDVRNRGGRLPFFITGWTGDFEHPEDYLPMLFMTGSSENRSGYSNPKVDRIFRRAAPLETIVERDSLYDSAHRLIIADAAAVPLFNPVDVEMIAPRVRGLTFSAYGHGSLGSVTKRRRDGT